MKETNITHTCDVCGKSVTTNTEKAKGWCQVKLEVYGIPRFCSNIMFDVCNDCVPEDAKHGIVESTSKFSKMYKAVSNKFKRIV